MIAQLPYGRPMKMYCFNSNAPAIYLALGRKTPIIFRSDRHPQSQKCTFSTSTAYSSNAKYKPKLDHDTTNEDTHILTLLTDAVLYQSMNALRRAYFPSNLNKIPAHITLFHALPGSKLESEIIPVLGQIVAKTAPYRISAVKPFRLSKGIGIRITDKVKDAKSHRQTNDKPITAEIHDELRRRWCGWLSEQDSSPAKLHYTIMNKVSDQEVVEEIFGRVEQAFKQSSRINGGQSLDLSQDGNELQSLCLQGEARGLTLWKYEDTGHWTSPKHFRYSGSRS